MMFCPNCGRRYNEGTVCPECNCELKAEAFTETIDDQSANVGLNNDEEELRSYYEAVYCSSLYSKMVSDDNSLSRSINSQSKVREKQKVWYVLLIFFIYLSINVSFKFEFPLIGVIILLPILVLLIGNKKLKKIRKERTMASSASSQATSEWNELKKKYKYPDIPKQYDNKNALKSLIEIFESGRAKTYQQAFIILEQDRQYQELLGRQRALQAAAANAQMEAEKAKRQAAQAQKEADYQRREAEYWRREEEYYRNR